MHILSLLCVTLGLCGKLLAVPTNTNPTNGCDISNETIHELRAQLIPLEFQPSENDEKHSDVSDNIISISKVDCDLRSETEPSDSSVFCLRADSAIGDILQPSYETESTPFVSRIRNKTVTCGIVESDSDMDSEDIKLRCSSVDSPRSFTDRPWLSKLLIFAVFWVTGCTIRKAWVDRRDRRASKQKQAAPCPEMSMSEKGSVTSVEDVDEFDDSNYPMG